MISQASIHRSASWSLQASKPEHTSPRLLEQPNECRGSPGGEGQADIRLKQDGIRITGKNDKITGHDISVGKASS
jgi:hypothetical protein